MEVKRKIGLKAEYESEIAVILPTFVEVSWSTPSNIWDIVERLCGIL
jgi:hypothetical protein